jgi:hypothetical protein
MRAQRRYAAVNSAESMDLKPAAGYGVFFPYSEALIAVRTSTSGRAHHTCDG